MGRDYEVCRRGRAREDTPRKIKTRAVTRAKETTLPVFLKRFRLNFREKLRCTTKVSTNTFNYSNLRLT
jgi:hypothetical protein